MSAIGRGSCSWDFLPGEAAVSSLVQRRQGVGGRASLLSMVQRAFKFFFALTGPSWWFPANMALNDRW